MLEIHLRLYGEQTLYKCRIVYIGHHIAYCMLKARLAYQVGYFPVELVVVVGADVVEAVFM